MQLAVAVAATIAGLGLGGAAGWALGKWSAGHRRRFWTLVSACLVASMALNYIGLTSGQKWLALGALGLMAGLLTGLKYGYAPQTRAW
jgi:hypothetical protein